jgi:hypothetical protein
MVNVPLVVIIHWQNKHMHMFMNDVKCISLIMETKISHNIIFFILLIIRNSLEKEKYLIANTSR